MKIVYVDETFHPAYGYQSAPLAKFQQMQGHEVVIITVSKDQLYPVYREFGDDGSSIDREDAVYQQTTGVKIIRVKTRGYFMHRAVMSHEMFRVVRAQKPDVVFVHCAETLTAMRFLLHRKEWPMMLDSHMLSMASKSRFVGLFEAGYRAVFRRIIERRRCYVIRTQDDDYVNTHLGIRKELTPFISFGTDTAMFCPSPEARASFRREHGIAESDFVVVYTGKLTETKGGKLLAETFEKKFDVPVTLVCVGTPPNDAYGREVQARLNASENRVILFPTQKYTELAPFYQMADLSVFPKQCSMSFYDAQSCGLPVVSEENNVNCDRCGHHNGENFTPGSAEDFRRKILQFAGMRADERAVYGANARAFIENGYDYDAIARRYAAYLEQSVIRFREQKKR